MAVKNKKRRLQPLGGKVKSNNGQNGESGVKERKEHHGRKKHGRVSDDEEFEIASSYIAPSSYSEAAVDSGGDSDNGDNTKELVQKQNRKHKKSGGFQSMGLSGSTFRGIMKKGYKVPTPIQRKTIPLILDGRDLVAMARTGSGKTAAFVVPMLERLKNHTPTGVRALIMSPTRELALQTFKFIKELGKFTTLKAAVILGGDRIEDQFATIHENPDVIVATPGRFMHVVVEMNLKLQSVEYVVFDEADRLFELGFQEQLSEILRRLPESRQTLLFSATLPKLLIEFAKAGLNNPTLVRLDVDTKLSEHLKMSYLLCRSEDKTAVLLSILRLIVKPKQQAIIFVATRHHVEYLNMILTEAGYECSYSYSALDPVARKQNIERFRGKQTSLLLVTDLAARGIDVPMLDHVINYNFPAKAKLFLHRVGRVARAGREGAAISLVAPDELPYLLDLHLFLGTPFNTATMTPAAEGEATGSGDRMLGRVPQHLIDSEEDSLRAWHADNDVANMKKVVANAYKQYAKSRPNPSTESVKRVKVMDQNALGYHPLFAANDSGAEAQRLQLLQNLKAFKPGATILEVNSTKRVQSANVMRATRGYNETAVQAHHAAAATAVGIGAASLKRRRDDVEDDRDLDLGDVASKRGKQQQVSAGKSNASRDEEYYVPYRPRDFNTERGLSLASSFDHQASSAQLDLVGDDGQTKAKFKGNQVWDRKKKKFVSAHGLEQKQKKVKTESGTWVNASYKKNLYEEWKKRSKQEENDADSADGDSDNDQGQGRGRQSKFQHSRQGKRRHRANSQERGNHGNDSGNKKRKHGSELHSKEKILKGRRQQWKKQAMEKSRGAKRQNKSKQRRGRT